jgi:hypothetical protein
MKVDPRRRAPLREPFVPTLPEYAMNAVPSCRKQPVRKLSSLVALVTIMLLAVAATAPSYALDLVTFAGVSGPLTSALTTLATLEPGAKAIVGFLAFVVALISLTAMRNFGPVIYYVGVAVFAAVGLPIAGAIMGAVI